MLFLMDSMIMWIKDFYRKFVRNLVTSKESRYFTILLRNVIWGKPGLVSRHLPAQSLLLLSLMAPLLWDALFMLILNIKVVDFVKYKTVFHSTLSVQCFERIIQFLKAN